MEHYQDVVLTTTVGLVTNEGVLASEGVFLAAAEGEAWVGCNCGHNDDWGMGASR